MIDIDRLLDRIDELYGAVVMDPTSWSDSTIHDWAGELFDAEKPDKETARGVRRCVRAAIKLQLFWIDSSNSRVDDAEDWRTRVDIALGGPAWRPTLELAQHGLRSGPTPELFAQVQHRFRLVYNQPWLEGVTYTEWKTAASPEAGT
ncbi:hypothetical protein MNBD_ACTINO02-1618 [hydrothermal vent metagenome]|uniref:Uncharacterized protein n=1 Tax=hydrothermal vent metagenome TaxID=652676 RepID=A0A3B0STK8_9ZZZZ